MPSSPVALVTAGSAGLGAATARLFAQNGMRVVVNFAHNQDRANTVVAELDKVSTLPASSANFKAIKADLGCRDELIQLVEVTVATMGRLDVVFSNGGWTKLTDIHNLDENMVEEDWDKCFNMNVKSHLFLMHAAQKHLAATEGAFITTASLAGVKSIGSSLAYSVTKAAQIHLVKGLAIAAGPKIRVNSVSPGLLLTEWGMQFSEQKRAELQDATQLKRFATVEDVAEQVMCFVRSKGTTGSNAVIDAGVSL